MLMINLTPSTELFSIWDFSIQTWGSIVAFGIIIGLLFFFIEAKKRKMYEKAEAMLVFMMLFGLILGRLAYIVVNINQFPSIYSWFELWNGGIISWGVLIGVIIGALFFKIISKTKFNELFCLLDIVAPYLILAIGIGRIGCFLAGCCYGIPSSLPWAVSYNNEAAVHPTQLYHFIADMIIFAILLKLYNKKKNLELHKAKSKFDFFNKSGSIFLMFLILFSAERFFIDFLRYHPMNEYYFLSITQWVFLALFMAAAISLKIKKK